MTHFAIQDLGSQMTESFRVLDGVSFAVNGLAEVLREYIRGVSSQ